jgi:hypothetical protein
MVALAIGSILGACSAPGSGGSLAGGSGSGGTGPATTAATASPSVVPSTATATATPALPSASVGSGTATPPAVSDAPVAVLVVGGKRHPGEVGGFTFGTYSQSAPWLPATALDTVEVPAGSTLGVELDDRATIAGWTARLATAADLTADAVTGIGEGAGPTASFAAPPVGDWVVSLTVTYGEGLGSGAYYWHVMVE